jgi:hypothetical protein
VNPSAKKYWSIIHVIRILDCLAILWTASFCALHNISFKKNILTDLGGKVRYSKKFIHCANCAGLRKKDFLLKNENTLNKKL